MASVSVGPYVQAVADEAAASFQGASGATHEAARSAATSAVEVALLDAYRFLRLVIGTIALLLPLVVALGDWRSIRESISSYYYGRTGNYFVGSLCALGVFFLSYNYAKIRAVKTDYWMSKAAFVLAIGVALFPTSSEGSVAKGGSLAVSRIHVTCAALLFVLLAVFALYEFPKASVALVGGPKKPLRNKIYRTCGIVILACVLGILGCNIADVNGTAVFWLESAAVWAFGTSWLVKSGYIRVLVQ